MYKVTNKESKILGIFTEKKNAKQFCAIEQKRLGTELKVKRVLTNPEKFVII
jgi:hypothetical protein